MQSASLKEGRKPRLLKCPRTRKLPARRRKAVRVAAGEEGADVDDASAKRGGKIC